MDRKALAEELRAYVVGPLGETNEAAAVEAGDNKPSWALALGAAKDLKAALLEKLVAAVKDKQPQAAGEALQTLLQEVWMLARYLRFTKLHRKLGVVLEDPKLWESVGAPGQVQEMVPPGSNPVADPVWDKAKVAVDDVAKWATALKKDVYAEDPERSLTDLYGLGGFLAILGDAMFAPPEVIKAAKDFSKAASAWKAAVKKAKLTGESLRLAEGSDADDPKNNSPERT